MSTMVKSNDWCPTCLLQNKVQSALMNRPGQFYTSCAAGHQFSDTEELNTLRQMARSQYPALYKSNAPAKPDPAALAAMAAADIVLNAEVKKAMEELAGVPITSGGDLKGLMYGYINDNKDKELEIRSLRASMAAMGKRASSAGAGAGASTAAGLAPGQFIVAVPEWAMAGVAAQAEYANKSPEEWVAEEFGNYFEAYFGAPAGGR